LTGVEELVAKGKRRRNRVSVQFGRWNIDGQPADRDYLAKAGEMLAPYGPDGGGVYIKDNVGILFRAFHTTKESRKEIQPFVTPSGAVVCWDGRLDNREEFIRELREVVTADSTDLAIVAAAYEAWGTKCFAKLIGDWALSVWDPISRSVILAKDLIGTRHVFYSFDKERVTWSTILDPLVLLAGKTFGLEEEYIAGWLSFFPATHLTPYVGIHSVPPSCFVRIEPGRQTGGKYWDFDPSKRIRYRTDGEYEEHFRQVFGESVRRRLRSDSPVLAELSGGMDSSSIVCMADAVMDRGAAETPGLDTISYYDDSDPNWNERPYFTKVEEKRGRMGCHIEVGSAGFSLFKFDSNGFAATPAASCRPDHASKQFAASMASQGNRVLLSGIGGDEVTGGVPTPTPELEDLLAKARFGALAHQLKAWALNKRKPWFHLCIEAARAFFPPAIVGVPRHLRPATWMNPDFVKRNSRALRGYHGRLRLIGCLPSFQDSIYTLDLLRRQLGCDTLSAEPPYEKRYPYLDRGLLEFGYAIPREQLVRPSQRRSLMRRALVGIVPDELLTRKRKAYATRAPVTKISAEWTNLIETCPQMVSASVGMVDDQAISEALKKVGQGAEIPIVPLMRALRVELWLRYIKNESILIERISNLSNDAWFSEEASTGGSLRKISASQQNR
jgi:asparagine synthase (glutamine-hydrolysing)